MLLPPGPLFPRVRTPAPVEVKDFQAMSQPRVPVAQSDALSILKKSQPAEASLARRAAGVCLNECRYAFTTAETRTSTQTSPACSSPEKTSGQRARLIKPFHVVGSQLFLPFFSSTTASKKSPASVKAIRRLQANTCTHGPKPVTRHSSIGTFSYYIFRARSQPTV